MSARTRLFDRVAVARRRLRDGAAAVAAAAEQVTREATSAQAEADEAIAVHEADATARYLAARGARDLLAYADERSLHRKDVELAGERVVKARSASDVARTALASRARDLEVIERKARELRTHEAAEAAKTEQKLLDDLGATRSGTEVGR